MPVIVFQLSKDAREDSLGRESLGLLFGDTSTGSLAGDGPSLHSLRRPSRSGSRARRSRRVVVKVDQARLLLLRASGPVFFVVVVDIEDRLFLSPGGGPLRGVRWGSRRGGGSKELVELGALEGGTGR